VRGHAGKGYTEGGAEKQRRPHRASTVARRKQGERNEGACVGVWACGKDPG